MGDLGCESTTKRVRKPLRCTCGGFQSSALGTSGDRGTLMIELLWLVPSSFLEDYDLAGEAKDMGGWK